MSDKAGLNDLLDEVNNSGTFTKRFFIKHGDTYFTPVIDPTHKRPYADLGYPSTSYFPDGSKSVRRAMRMIVLSTDDAGKLEPGYEERVSVGIIPFSVFKEVVRLLSDEDKDLTATSIDTDGNVTPGTLFKVSKSGSGRDTEYKVTDLTAKKVVERYPIPESIDEFESVDIQAEAEAYETFSKSMADGSNDPEPEQAPGKF